MKNRNYLNLAAILSVVILTGCGNRKVFDVENIDYLYVDHDIYVKNNTVLPFTGTISAQMKTGESIKLPSGKGFSSSENILVDFKENTISIDYSFPTFANVKIPVQLTYGTRRGASITSVDSVLLNFTGNTQVAHNGISGADGDKGDSKWRALFTRDGSDGESGEPGEDGTNGDDLEIYIWKCADSLFCYVHNRTLNQKERYLVIGSEAVISISCRGGSGGDGGKGGKGGIGKDEKVKENSSKPPGDGGNGGSGGAGGRGGDGGDVILNVHPSAAGSENQIVIVNSGGLGGDGGKGGKGGSGGSNYSENQASGIDGRDGFDAGNGEWGTDGQLKVVENQFNYLYYR